MTVADTPGNIHFIAGSPEIGFAGDGSSVLSAVFAVPIFVSAAANGDILLSDVGNFRLRRIHSGIINTVAVNSILDNIPATSAFLSLPDGLVPDGKGGLLIADTVDSRIRHVSSGTIGAFYGSGYAEATRANSFFHAG